MTKFVAIVAVVVLMILLTEAKEFESAHQRAAAEEVSRQARSVSDAIARAMKRSPKNSKECADFGDECSYWTSCCEGKGLECQSDNDSWFSKGTCWMKF